MCWGVDIMFERFICLIISLLSLVSVYYSSKHMDVTQDSSYVARSNYVDVYFTEATSKNGSSVSITSNQKEITIQDLSFQEVGEEEVIQYVVYNNSFSYDVDINLLVEGENDYFTVTTSDIETISSGESKTGEITIQYQKASLENREVPIKVTLQVQAK